VKDTSHTDYMVECIKEDPVYGLCLLEDIISSGDVDELKVVFSWMSKILEEKNDLFGV